jgi:hypothetical protein
MRDIVVRRGFTRNGFVRRKRQVVLDASVDPGRTAGPEAGGEGGHAPARRAPLEAVRKVFAR